MKVNQGDTAKVAVLVVAIVAIIGFVAYTALTAGKKGKPVNSPAVASAPSVTNTIGSDPAPLPGAGEVPPPSSAGVNPFRKTVATNDPSTGPSNPPSNPPPRREIQGQIPARSNESVPPMKVSVPDDVEFRLDGVLVTRNSLAMVTRAGKTEALGIGAHAAYGYRIVGIQPAGIRLARKGQQRLLRVGERLDPPGSSSSPSGPINLGARSVKTP